MSALFDWIARIFGKKKYPQVIGYCAECYTDLVEPTGSCNCWPNPPTFIKGK